MAAKELDDRSLDLAQGGATAVGNPGEEDVVHLSLRQFRPNPLGDGTTEQFFRPNPAGDGTTEHF